MLLDTAARGWKEIVMLNLNDGHTDTAGILVGVGILLAASVAIPPQLADLFLVFRGEEIGEYQQATGQSWQHQCLTCSKENKLETFFFIFPIPDETKGLRAES